jgi:tetratricopeptide (TPR) repeat protein
MTIPPIQGTGPGIPPLRIQVLTAPVSKGVPPVIGDEPLLLPPAPQSPSSTTGREDPPISLAGRLDSGDQLPETTQLALALESATRAMQKGRADQVLHELDAVWSSQLAADSPWYLRTAALQLLGRMSDAEQVMRDAIARLPRSAALLYLLGVHTAFRGQGDAARLANDHALSLHPTEPLLWLQRAALLQNAGLPGDAAAILEHVQTMEPAYPSAQWLATLMRLGEARSRSPTPTVQRTILRLTPSSSEVIAEPPRPTPTLPMQIGVLETAVRYGLTLLESPTQSARTATQIQAAGDPGVVYAESISAAGAAAAASSPPKAESILWESIILVTAILVIAFVPPLRIPALMISGAMAMLMVSKRAK